MDIFRKSFWTFYILSATGFTMAVWASLVNADFTVQAYNATGLDGEVGGLKLSWGIALMFFVVQSGLFLYLFDPRTWYDLVADFKDVAQAGTKFNDKKAKKLARAAMAVLTSLFLIFCLGTVVLDIISTVEGLEIERGVEYGPGLLTQVYKWGAGALIVFGNELLAIMAAAFLRKGMAEQKASLEDNTPVDIREAKLAREKKIKDIERKYGD